MYAIRSYYGHGSHDFHRRFDQGAQARPGELTGVDGAVDRQRHGEQHGVEGPLEGAEDQRHQAQLRFVVVVGGGGLPDIGRLVVPFVSDLAEQGAEADLGVSDIELSYNFV